MNIYLYVLNTLADWEIAFLTAEVNSKRFFNSGNDEIIRLIKIGNTTESITTMGGMKITPDVSIENIDFNNNDMLVLPGADTWMNKENQKIIKIVSALLDRKINIAAICGATIALASNGLLNKRKHTSNDKEFLKMVCPDYSGSDYYVNQSVVVDDNLITATGLAPLEFTYEILKKMNTMKRNTLESWYGLYQSKEPKYFYSLMESLK